MRACRVALSKITCASRDGNAARGDVSFLILLALDNVPINVYIMNICEYHIQRVWTKFWWILTETWFSAWALPAIMAAATLPEGSRLAASIQHFPSSEYLENLVLPSLFYPNCCRLCKTRVSQSVGLEQSYQLSWLPGHFRIEAGGATSAPNDWLQFIWTLVTRGSCPWALKHWRVNSFFFQSKTFFLLNVAGFLLLLDLSPEGTYLKFQRKIF